MLRALFLTLLLCPLAFGAFDVTIGSGSLDIGGVLSGVNPLIWLPDATNSVISALTITTQLALGIDVQITNGNSGSQAGNIFVNSSIALALGIGRLELQATNSIIISKSINIKGDVTLTASNGDITLDLNAGIVTNGNVDLTCKCSGGLVLSSSVQGAEILVNTTVGNLNIDADVTLDSGSNSLTLAAGGAITITSGTITGADIFIQSAFAASITGSAHVSGKLHWAHTQHPLTVFGANADLDLLLAAGATGQCSGSLKSVIATGGTLTLAGSDSSVAVNLEVDDFELSAGKLVLNLHGGASASADLLIVNDQITLSGNTQFDLQFDDDFDFDGDVYTFIAIDCSAKMTAFANLADGGTGGDVSGSFYWTANYSGGQDKSDLEISVHRGEGSAAMALRPGFKLW